MENVLDGIIKIVNERSPRDIRIKGRKGDHPFYRGLYLVMALKHVGATGDKIAKYIGMNHSATCYWSKNLEGWFFTRKDLKKERDAVDREIEAYVKSLGDPNTFDAQAKEVLNRMSA